MNKIEHEQNKKLNTFLAMVRLAGTIFIGIAAISFIPMEALPIINQVQITLAIGIAIFFYAWLDLSYIHKQPRMWAKPSWPDYVEAAVWAAASAYIVYLTGAQHSLFKMIFTFIITAQAFQFGIPFGFVPASLSSAGLMIVDIIGAGISVRNIYLEGDLVYIGFFFILAWMIGYFSQEEKAYIQRLARMADTDELTGLYNHRAFQDKLDQAIKEARRSGKPFWLLIIDIDHFRNYNRSYGHYAGDQVLKQMVSIISSKVPDAILTARYGGDKFAIILNDMPEQALISLGQSIKTAINQYPFYGVDMLPGSQLNVSIGAVKFPMDGQDKSHILNALEDTLYKAKSIKREGVELYYSVLDEIKQEIGESEKETLATIRSLISIINIKDRYTYGHTERVVIYAKALAAAMKLSEQQMRNIQYAAYLHDVGKIEVDERILNKPGKLLPEEWAALKKHPIWGVEIIKPIKFLERVMPAILYHHERWDGTGYPDGLKGEDIPLEARILSLADAYDAMTTDRPYKQAMSKEQAIKEILNNAGTQFDPYIAEIFTEVIEDEPLRRISSISI